MYKQIRFFIVLVVCFFSLSACTARYTLNVIKNDDKTNTVKVSAYGCENYLPDIYVDEDGLSFLLYCPYYDSGGETWKIGAASGMKYRMLERGESVPDYLKQMSKVGKEAPSHEIKYRYLEKEILPDYFRLMSKVRLEPCGRTKYENNFTEIYCGEDVDAGYTFRLWKDTQGVMTGLRSPYNHLECTFLQLSPEEEQLKAKRYSEKKRSEAIIAERKRQEEERIRQERIAQDERERRARIAQERETQQRELRAKQERIEQEERKRQERERRINNMIQNIEVVKIGARESSSSTRRPVTVKVIFSCPSTPNKILYTNIDTYQTKNRSGEWILDKDEIKNYIGGKMCGE